MPGPGDTSKPPPGLEVLHLLQQGRIGQCQAWQRICTLLSPSDPFEAHQSLLNQVYAGWDAALRGPPPIWFPNAEQAKHTNLATFMRSFQGDPEWRRRRAGDPCALWPLLLQASRSDPEAFWSAVLQQLQLRLHTSPRRILQAAADPDQVRWLPGARLNIAESALRCPRAPSLGGAALVWADEAQPERLHSMSYRRLQQQALHLAACLAREFQPGDAIAIMTPMTPESVIIYLGIILAGCVVVSIADSFAAAEVSMRLRISGAKAIFTQDVVMRGGRALPLYPRVKEAVAPLAIVLPGLPGGTVHEPSLLLRPGDRWWGDFIAAASGGSSGEDSARKGYSGDCEGCRGSSCGCSSQGCGDAEGSWAAAAAAATASCGRPVPHVSDPDACTNILFSSGTSGEPKAIPWSHVTPLRAACDGWAHQDVHPGDTVCWPTNLGWMMGPWLLYASLLNGATVALFQGAPHGREFGRFVVAARVRVLGVVPSLVQSWRSSGCMAGLDWSDLRCFSSTGEASAPEDYHWLMSRVPGYRPVIEYCGGTEIGGAFLTGTLLQPQSPSYFSTPSIGCELLLIDAHGSLGLHDPLQPVIGELALVPPLLGSSQRLLNRDHHQVYYAGMPRHPDGSGRVLRRHGDEVRRLPGPHGGHYYQALGRCDDTMNLGGIKVSSAELERAVVEGVPSVSEVAAVGVPSPGGGPELLHLFVALSPAAAGEGAGAAPLHAACQAALRARLNPLFKVDKVWKVAALPRTASNKVLRRELRAQAAAQPRL